MGANTHFTDNRDNVRHIQVKKKKTVAYEEETI